LNHYSTGVKPVFGWMCVIYLSELGTMQNWYVWFSRVR